MKRFLYLIPGILLYYGETAAQTLEFSQVILVNSNTSTVPPGKVWKVEKAVPSGGIVKVSSSGTSTPTGGSYFEYTVNGTGVPVNQVMETMVANNTGSSSNSTSMYIGIDQEAFPLWLPAGTTLAAGTGLLYLSVIEFTVVP